MINQWNDEEAANYSDGIGLRVYSSRLLGRDKSLVLHGGGNTSVKMEEEDMFGHKRKLLYVKGSGWDLETIEPEGFSPVDLEYLNKLATLPELSDSEMVNEMVTHMTRATAPSPSVEAILHAILPYKYVDHTHADAVISITNTPEGDQYVKEIYGDKVVYIPYVMPGFDLARLCAEIFSREANEQTEGMILMNHGVFSFGDTAKKSYNRMIQLVSMAEDFLKSKKAWNLPEPECEVEDLPELGEMASFRKKISKVAGRPVIVSRSSDSANMEFSQHPQKSRIALQGPATPDHVIRTKRVPMIDRDIESYARDYETYFKENESRGKSSVTMLDPAPRVVLDKDWGLLTIGKTAAEAAVVEEIYTHTVGIILRAELLDKWQALPAGDIFDVEYWELEQAKLAKNRRRQPFGGEVALVTGAASGIGQACVSEFLNQGASVIGVDINPSVAEMHKRHDYLGIPCDLTDEAAVRAALNQSVAAYGGVDMLVANAGIFPESCILAEMSYEDWSRVFKVNLDASFHMMRSCHSLLKEAPAGGRIVVVGSKNVKAPGPGAAAYSASKAALNQLARVAAMEWGCDDIRVNVLNPNAVFDTGIWNDQVIKKRAAQYGISEEEYKRNNVLRVSIESRHVAALAADLCGSNFSRTTGAQIPVDGGNDRVI